MKIGVTYPWDSPFTWSKFANNTMNLERPKGYDVRFFEGRGFCPARKHADGFEKCISWGADLLCIIGADQVHPEDLLPRLVARMDEGCDVITAMVPFRGYTQWQNMKPFQPMAWRVTGDGPFRGVAQDGDRMRLIDPADGELQEVDIIGSGVTMLETTDLLRLERPWFNEKIHPKTFQRMSDMDTRFMHRLKTELGLKMFVDTTIKVRHLHDMEITEDFQDRFADWAEPGKGDPNMCRYTPEGAK